MQRDGQLQQIEGVAQRLVFFYVHVGMKKFLYHKVASIFHPSDDFFRFVQDCRHAGWIHLFVVMSEIGMRELLVFFHTFQLNLTLPFLLFYKFRVIVKQGELYVIGT